MNPKHLFHIGGIGLWTPGFANADAWHRRDYDQATSKPSSALIPARQRRRASTTTLMASAVIEQAAQEQGCDVHSIPMVFGSVLGEIDTTIALLEMQHADGELSPLRFQNSVHNTPGGGLSIALGNPARSTAISAGDDLAAMAVIEAMALLATTGGDVLVVLVEERSPELLMDTTYPPLAVALHLTTDAPARSLGQLTHVWAQEEHPASESEETPAPLMRNPCAGLLPLFAAIHTQAAATVRLDVTRAPRNAPNDSLNTTLSEPAWLVHYAPPSP